MKIIYIHQYFKTYEEGGSSRSYYLARSLVEAGHEVEMITSYNGSQYKKQLIDGISVHYLPVFYKNGFGFWRRMLAFSHFIWQAYRCAMAVPGADLCYATSTPLTVGIIALLLKKRRHLPFYFEVRDLWPLAPVELGFIRNRFVKKKLFALEASIYREATKIIALSPAMAQYVAARCERRKVHVIPNMADCDFFRKEKKQDSLLQKFDITTQIVVTYFGAVGQVNRVDHLLEVARFAQQSGLHNIVFMIAGEGKMRHALQQKTIRYRLRNTHFLGHLTKHEVRDLLNVTDAVYISFDEHPVLETSSPNKFFDALSAGKLCIVNTNGWIRELVELEGCGFYADPKEPAQFINQLFPYLTNKTLLEQVQHRARMLAENHFARKLLTKQFVRLFEQKTMPASLPKAAHPPGISFLGYINAGGNTPVA